MKPRLLKFTCHSCGARLAVPPEMAGLSDHCPKCGVLVTAPAMVEAASITHEPQPAAPVAAPVAQAPEGWSADALADALKPQPRKPQPEPRRETQPDLLAPTPSPELPQTGAEPVQPLRKPAHEVLDSILRRKEPAAQAAPAVTDEQPVIETPTALVPHQVTDAREAEKAVMPGMGEVLSGSGLGGVSPPHAESRPFLHVPFVPVRSAPGEERRAKLTHFKVMAIICFLLFDVLALFLWKDQIFGWLGGNKKDEAVEHPPPVEASTAGEQEPAKGLGSTRPGPLSTETPETPGTPVEPPVAATPTPAPVSPSSVPGGLPLAPLPSGIMTPAATTLQPTLAAGSLTIAAPSDFSTNPGSPAGSAASAPPAVPMAIPLPGHSSENVPTATPVNPSAPTPAPETKDSPAAPPPPAASTAPPAPGPATAAVMAPSAAEAPVPSPPPVTAPSPPATAEIPSPPATAPVLDTSTRRIGRVPPDAKNALEGLLKFLDAPTWRERSAHAQKPEVILGAMEKYAAASGDGPVVVGQVDFVERYPGKGTVPPYCMFELGGGSLTHPVLVLVEQSTKNGVRVDWEAFIEFKDDLLLRFLEKKGAPPQKFRVLLRRKHYFDKDVPDIAGKDSFQLDQPNSHFEGHVFVSRNSPLGRQLANQLAWGQDMPVIAELVWKSDAKSWWVEIGNIVSYGWRG